MSFLIHRCTESPNSERKKRSERKCIVKYIAETNDNANIPQKVEQYKTANKDKGVEVSEPVEFCDSIPGETKMILVPNIKTSKLFPINQWIKCICCSVWINQRTCMINILTCLNIQWRANNGSSILWMSLTVIRVLGTWGLVVIHTMVCHCADIDIWDNLWLIGPALGQPV